MATLSNTLSAQSIVLLKDSFYLTIHDDGVCIHAGTFTFSKSNANVQTDLYRNRHFIDRIRRVAALLPELAPQYVELTGTTSAEGSATLNAQLATKRAEQMCMYLYCNMPNFKKQQFHIKTKNYTWSEMPDNIITMLDKGNKCIETQFLSPQRGVHVAIFCKATTDNIICQFDKSNIKYITNEEVWRDNTAPTPQRQQKQPKQQRQPKQPKQQKAQKYQRAQSEETNYQSVRRYIALKNNMLYDAALLPNIGMEISLGSRWSVAVEGNWSWWGSSKEYSDRVWRIQTAAIELRKWLGSSSWNNTLNGHYIGVYGMAGTYDIRLKSPSEAPGYLSNGTWSAGLTYGYSIPVAKRLNIELGIGMGYATGEYKSYYYSNDSKTYNRNRTAKLQWVGPTKASISLVWLIGSGKNR